LIDNDTIMINVDDEKEAKGERGGRVGKMTGVAAR
jgi:hypothetical protein